MTARVLVVDDLLPNVRFLQARLSAEYYEVLTAASGAEALTYCAAGLVDLVLLDVMMPGMDGFETCRRLKADARTAHIPVVMVTSLDQTADRVRGLDAGADDFLTKPVDEVALIARVRSLARLKTMLDTLRAGARTAGNLGLSALVVQSADAPRVLIVDGHARSAERLTQALAPEFSVVCEADAQAALLRAADGAHDLAIISLALEHFDPLRLVSQLRSIEDTRDLPVLLVADLEDRARVLRGLDLGVNDYIMRPIDRHELVARARTQVRRKLYADALRDKVRASMELAIVDALTGLHNRRYLDAHLPGLMSDAHERGAPLSMMVIDIDHFKAINDSHGHDAGDDVLRLVAQRLRGALRDSDLVCRLGGEEFVAIMPETDLALAGRIAERARMAIADHPFAIGPARRLIGVTVSAGLAEAGAGGTPLALYRRADAALYRSKQAGRNRVCADAA